MQLLPAAARVARPWKNGGGITREIAAWPPGAGFADFDWRVSMAEVSSDGPFSIFPETDRLLAVLEGELQLTVRGETHDLTPGTPPICFPGDVPADGHLANGPVLDLNLMTRRGRLRSQLQVLHLARPYTLDSSGVTLVLSGGKVVGDDHIELARYDALLRDGGDPPVTLRAGAPVRIYVASFDAV